MCTICFYVLYVLYVVAKKPMRPVSASVLNVATFTRFLLPPGVKSSLLAAESRSGWRSRHHYFSASFLIQRVAAAGCLYEC